jgi:RHH-type rel operon transcriptional repressor/antitoxin RelB
MAISLRLNDQDAKLFKKYAELKGMSVSELVRQSVFEKIEDEYDLEAYEKARADYQENSVTYSLDDVKEELGLK